MARIEKTLLRGSDGAWYVTDPNLLETTATEEPKRRRRRRRPRSS